MTQLLNYNHQINLGDEKRLPTTSKLKLARDKHNVERGLKQAKGKLEPSKMLA